MVFDTGFEAVGYGAWELLVFVCCDAPHTEAQCQIEITLYNAIPIKGSAFIEVQALEDTWYTQYLPLVR